MDQNSRENVGSQENSKMLLQKLSHLIAKGKFKSWTGRKNSWIDILLHTIADQTKRNSFDPQDLSHMI